MCAFVFTGFFFFNDPATTDIYTLSLHDALPISRDGRRATRRLQRVPRDQEARSPCRPRSEEHTSELQSHSDLVCRLLLEKKKKNNNKNNPNQIQTSTTIHTRTTESQITATQRHH